MGGGGGEGLLQAHGQPKPFQCVESSLCRSHARCFERLFGSRCWPAPARVCDNEVRHCSYPSFPAFFLPCSVLLQCHAPRKEYYKKFLFEPLPVESHLDHFLHDHMGAEVVTR